MNELEIQGKKYISSKRASELTGYAKDYIGQLARAGKIPGTRVGMAWYVEEGALLSHTNSDSEALNPLSVVSPLQPRAVISPATLRALGYRTVRNLPETWTSAVYFSDDSDLVPKIEKKQGNEPRNDVLPETVVRIKIMERPAFPKPPVAESIRVISEKAKKIRHKRKIKDTALSFGAVAAALSVFLFFSSGFVLSSHISLNQESGAHTANLAIGFQYARDTLMKFPPFAMGVSSLHSFFAVLWGSFYLFLDRGSAFVLWIFHWLASLV